MVPGQGWSSRCPVTSQPPTSAPGSARRLQPSLQPLPLPRAPAPQPHAHQAPLSKGTSRLHASASSTVLPALAPAQEESSSLGGRRQSCMKTEQGSTDLPLQVPSSLQPSTHSLPQGLWGAQHRAGWGAGLKSGPGLRVSAGRSEVEGCHTQGSLKLPSQGPQESQTQPGRSFLLTELSPAPRRPPNTPRHHSTEVPSWVLLGMGNPSGQNSLFYVFLFFSPQVLALNPGPSHAKQARYH